MTESDQPSDQLPAIIPPTALTTSIEPDLRLVPALIADAGAREPAHHEALRPDEGVSHPRRDREDSAVS
jgi:hypothetical protein